MQIPRSVFSQVQKAENRPWPVISLTSGVEFDEGLGIFGDVDDPVADKIDSERRVLPVFCGLSFVSDLGVPVENLGGSESDRRATTATADLVGVLYEGER